MSEKEHVLQRLAGLYCQQSTRFRERWNRLLPFSEMIVDRWEKAKQLGFGEGANRFHVIRMAVGQDNQVNVLRRHGEFRKMLFYIPEKVIVPWINKNFLRSVDEVSVCVVRGRVLPHKSMKTFGDFHVQPRSFPRRRRAGSCLGFALAESGRLSTSKSVVSLKIVFMELKAFPHTGRIGQVAMLSQQVSLVRQSTKVNFDSSRRRISQRLISCGAFASICPPFGPLTLVINFAFFSGIMSCSRYLMGIFWFFDMSDMLIGPFP